MNSHRIRYSLQRAFAFFLTVCLLIGGSPPSVLAVDGYTKAEKERKSSNSLATITKSAQWDDPSHSNGNYDATITINANVKPQTSSVADNADIVLILDVSGSLAKCTGEGHYDLSTYSTKSGTALEWSSNSGAVRKTFQTSAGYAAGNYEFTGLEVWPLLNADGSPFYSKNWDTSKGHWYIVPKRAGTHTLDPENFYAVINIPSQQSSTASNKGHFHMVNGRLTRIGRTNQEGEISVGRIGASWETSSLHNAVYTDNCMWAESSQGCSFGYDDAEEAAQSFVDYFAGNSNVRIAIVPFAGEVSIGGFSNSSATLSSQITAAYSSLGYMTNYDKAMGATQTLFSTSAADNKFCVFVTDGACDLGDGHTADQAATNKNYQDSMKKASEIKNDGITMYAVGFGDESFFKSTLAPFDSASSPQVGTAIGTILTEIANSIGSTINNSYTDYNVTDEISQYFDLISVENGNKSGSKWTSSTFKAGTGTGNLKLHIRLKSAYQNPDDTEYYPTNSTCSVNYGKAKLPVATPVLEVPPGDGGDDGGGGTASGALWVVGVEPERSYKAGEEVVSSFYVGSTIVASGGDGKANIGFTGKKLSYNGHTDTSGSKNTSGCQSGSDIQDYEFASTQLGTVSFTATCNGSSGASETKSNVYIPFASKGDKTNGNLVYFKWTVPSSWTSGTVTCKATIKASYSYERFKNKAERHVHTPGHWGGADEDGDGVGDTWISAKYDYQYSGVYDAKLSKSPSGNSSFTNNLNPRTKSETPDTTYEAGRPSGWTQPSSHSESSKNSNTWKMVTGYSGAANSQFNNSSFVRSSYGATVYAGSSSSASLEGSSVGTCDGSGYASIKPYKKQMIQLKSSSGAKTTYTTRSGYGFELGVLTEVRSTGSTALKSDMVTPVQEVWAEFPEFNYSTSIGSFRTLEEVSSNSSSRKGLWHFEKNKWSDDLARCHYTPLWYPDGDYKVNVKSTECWTPAGVIERVDNNNLLKISGSLYDDWHIQRGPQKYDIYGNPII